MDESLVAMWLGVSPYAPWSQHDGSARRLATLVLDGRDSLNGERVGILAEPGAGFVEAFFAVQLAGGVGLVLSPLHPAAQSRALCDDARAVTVLVTDHELERARAIDAAGATRLRLVRVEDAQDTSVAPLVRVARPAAGDAALQLYTSGTTGRPKGAVLSHENLCVQTALLRDAWGWESRDVLLHALPLHHMHGLAIAWLTCVSAGATALLRAFDAPKLWDAMREATVFMAVPTMYAKLFAAFDAASPDQQAQWADNARHLRLATSGSAALPVRVGERWAEIAGKYPLERFGMTEIGVGLSNPLHGERKPGHVGFPLPTVETKILDDERHPADTGELWVRGPRVFAQYFNRDEETRASFADLDDDGKLWFRTGDTVMRDLASKHFRILGRTSQDIVKSGGYKLSALEIEEVLREHPAVLEVSVVGRADDTWGERVCACIVLRAGVTPDRSEAEGEMRADEAELKAFMKAKVAPYMVPREFVFLTDLPKNLLGKVVKPELRAQLDKRDGSDSAQH